MNRKLRVAARFKLRRSAVIGVCVLAQSCASPLVNSAKQDDLPTFRATLQSAEKPVSERELVEVARAIAERELLSMPPDKAVARVTELEACVPELTSTFQKLSLREDVVGAIATQILLDQGAWKGSRDELIERHDTNPNPEWRAVAARAAVASKHGEARRAAFLDGDLRVRRAALRAARDARDTADSDALLEAARLDPDPVARRFALEATSAIADRESLKRLRDLWPHADESVRREIVLAWGRKQAFANGGKARLAWVLDTQTGIPRLAAAVIVLQRSREVGETSPEAVAAEGVLVRGFSDGSADEQNFVARYAPRTPEVVNAFAHGLKSPDEQTAVNAASVLVRGIAWRKEANERLTALLASKAPDVAERAREVLARERSLRVKEDLRKDLAAPQATTRLAAATRLLRYHRAGEAGLGLERLLADPDAGVRTSVACELIKQLAD